MSLIPPAGTVDETPPPSLPADAPAEIVAWNRLLHRLRGAQPHLSAMLAHAVVLDCSTGCIRVAWEPGHPVATLACTEDARRLVAAVAHSLDGVQATVELAAPLPEGHSKLTLASLLSSEQARQQREAYDRAREHPLVQDALAVLGGRLRELSVPE